MPNIGGSITAVGDTGSARHLGRISKTGDR
jgi:hypothetical protein